MLKRNKALQSTSQIVLRNSVIVILVGFNIIFFVVPVIIALMGSFHQWDPIVEMCIRDRGEVFGILTVGLAACFVF